MILRIVLFAFLPLMSIGQAIGVKGFTKITDGKSGFSAYPSSDALGAGMSSIGDINGDGIIDLAALAIGSSGKPIIYILMMNGDGTVKEQQVISPGDGAFVGDVNSNLRSLQTISSLGDVNGDGVPDIAISSSILFEIYVLFLNKSGTLKGFTRLRDGQNGLVLDLPSKSDFGYYMHSLGDFDNDGLTDLLVSDLEYNGGHGSIYVLSLDAEGKVKKQARIQRKAEWSIKDEDNIARFGISISSLSDLNGNKVPEILVGARAELVGSARIGAVYCLFPNEKYEIDSVKLIQPDDFGFLDSMAFAPSFGRSVSNVGDVDGNGFEDILVTSNRDSACGHWSGTGVLMYMDKNLSVDTFLSIACWTKGLGFAVKDDYGFGWSAAGVGDQNGDGMLDIAIAARQDDEGGEDAGAIYIINLYGKTYVNTPSPTSNEFTIYPNPTTGYFSINTQQKAEVTVLNTIGQVLWQGQANGSISIDASQWKPGMYLVQLQENNGIITTQKLIIH